MGFASTSVILRPKRAGKLVLAAQHNLSVSKLDLCFPVTHSSFSVCPPSILSLSSINHHFSHGLHSSFGPSYSVPPPPTLLKAAQFLSGDLPGGFHQVSHGIISHVPSSPRVWSRLLSALQLCHFSVAFRSSALEQQCPQPLERDATWLLSTTCPPARGQPTEPHSATGEQQASSALTSYASW